MRAASTALRRCTPTIARSSSGVLSTISCAIRTSVRRMSSRSRTTFSGLRGNSLRPSWPLWTGLKVAPGNVAARPAGTLPPAALSDRRLGRVVAAHVHRLAALGKRQLDAVEVARHDRPLENGARLVAQLSRRVARRDVRESQQRDL